MNVIITMAGDGNRFRQVGFSQPKHEIIARKRSLIEWALLSLGNFFDNKFIFVTRTEHNSRASIVSCAQKLGIRSLEIRELSAPTQGQADTAMEAAICITKTSEPILIFNIDTYVEPAFLSPDMIKGDGWLPAFTVDGDRWSFVCCDASGRVSEVREKERISEFGTIGLYYFSSFDLYRKCWERYQFKAYPERFVAPLYEYMIKELSLPVYTEIVPSRSVHVLGTPEDIVRFDPSFEEQLHTPAPKSSTSLKEHAKRV